MIKGVVVVFGVLAMAAVVILFAGIGYVLWKERQWRAVRQKSKRRG